MTTDPGGNAMASAACDQAACGATADNRPIRPATNTIRFQQYVTRIFHAARLAHLFVVHLLNVRNAVPHDGHPLDPPSQQNMTMGCPRSGCKVASQTIEAA